MDIGRAVRCAHWSFCIRVALFIVVLWAEKLRVFKARRCELEERGRGCRLARRD